MENNSLEERFKIFEARQERLEAAREIENLKSKYEYKLSAGLLEEVAELFALKTPGVSVELGSWGKWQGPEVVRKLYVEGHQITQTGGRISGMPPGVWLFDPTTTPVIEVAGDGKTAKGLWVATGQITIPGKDGKFEANWFWSKHGCDFIKEDGEWKIWHYLVVILFRAPYYKSWVDFSEEKSSLASTADRLPAELKPNTIGTYHHKNYGITNVFENFPPAPEPYQTWEDTFSY